MTDVFGIELRCLCGGPLGQPVDDTGGETARVVTYQCGCCHKHIALQLVLRPVLTVAETRICDPAGARQSRANRAACGTDSGYSAHRRRGEQPCRQCLDAHNTATKDRDRRRRMELIG